jgi:hypothetical protein
MLFGKILARSCTVALSSRRQPAIKIGSGIMGHGFAMAEEDQSTHFLTLKQGAACDKRRVVTPLTIGWLQTGPTKPT